VARKQSKWRENNRSGLNGQPAAGVSALLVKLLGIRLAHALPHLLQHLQQQAEGHRKKRRRWQKVKQHAPTLARKSN
jgi:hypothetical protein